MLSGANYVGSQVSQSEMSVHTQSAAGGMHLTPPLTMGSYLARMKSIASG